MSRSDNLGDLVKANLYMGNINQRQDDVKAVFFNPDEASDTGRGYKDPNFYGSMPFEVLRRMGDIFVVRAVVNTRVEQVQNFLHFSTDEQKEGYTIRRKRNPFEKVSAERSREDQIKINYIRKFLEEGGFHDKWESFDTFQDFGRKVVFDSLTLDQLAFEIVRDRSWNLARYRAVDASLVRFLTVSIRSSMKNLNSTDSKDTYRNIVCAGKVRSCSIPLRMKALFLSLGAWYRYPKQIDQHL